MFAILLFRSPKLLDLRFFLAILLALVLSSFLTKLHASFKTKLCLHYKVMKPP